MKTITGTIGAYLWSPIYGPQDLQDPQRALSACSFFAEDPKDPSYVRVGNAEITLTLLDEERVREHAVAGLHRQIEEVRAEAQQKITRIEEQIQSLLALTYEERP